MSTQRCGRPRGEVEFAVLGIDELSLSERPRDPPADEWSGTTRLGERGRDGTTRCIVIDHGTGSCKVGCDAAVFGGL